jgi:hypothetical protein
MRHRAERGALLLCALVVAACGLLPGGPVVRLENMSNSPATVDVNGTWVGTYAGGTAADVYFAKYGQPPYTVTVRTPNGLIAAQVEVTAADVEAGAYAAGNVSGRADLPCGTIRLSYGAPAEPLPAVAVAGLPACS